jgi:hypothetical protein
VIDLFKLLGAPGSIPFLVVTTVTAVILLRFTRRFRRAGAVLLALVGGGYFVLALPVVSHSIAIGLPDVHVERPGRLETLIVLDGDNRRGRVRELERVIESDAPTTIWVLGDEWILEALKDAGVSGPQFRYDGTARTTQAQVLQVADIAKAGRPGTTAVIASRLQAPRVVALIRAIKCPVAVFASPVDAEPPTRGLARFVPMYIALRLSRDAIYEHLALVYYRLRRFVER